MSYLTSYPVLSATDFYQRPSKNRKIVTSLVSLTLSMDSRDASASKRNQLKLSSHTFSFHLVVHPQTGLNFERLHSRRPEAGPVEAKYWLVPGDWASAEYSKVLSVVRLWLSAGCAAQWGNCLQLAAKPCPPTPSLSLSLWPENNQTNM